MKDFKDIIKKVIVIYRIIFFIFDSSCCFSYRAPQFSFYSTFVIQYPVKRLFAFTVSSAAAAAAANVFW